MYLNAINFWLDGQKVYPNMHCTSLGPLLSLGLEVFIDVWHDFPVRVACGRGHRANLSVGVGKCRLRSKGANERVSETLARLKMRLPAAALQTLNMRRLKISHHK